MEKQNLKRQSDKNKSKFDSNVLIFDKDGQKFFQTYNYWLI